MLMQKSSIIKCILFVLIFWGAILIAPRSLHAEVLPDGHQGHTHIVYILFGGTNNPFNQSDFTTDQGEIYLRAPYKNGFAFKGWYLDSHYTHRVHWVDTSSAMTLVLYARWDANIDNVGNVMNYPYEEKLSFLSTAADYYALKNMDYYFLEDLNIPGMPSTKEKDFISRMISSTDQLPQGFCFTEKYVLITAYSTQENAMGELMVFDRETNSYLVTLAMDPKSHLGGVAFDGLNVWVCNSKRMTIERISLDFIDLMVNKNRGEVVDASAVVDSYKVSNKPSCISFYDGRIWVATHNILMNGKLVSYYYDGNRNTLKKMGGYTIPSKVQGIAFDSFGHVYLSTSYGRNSSSYLKIYQSVADLSAQPNRPVAEVEMPPGSEEIDIDPENDIHVVFETAGEKYYLGTDGKGIAEYPLDKLLIIPNISEQIFP